MNGNPLREEARSRGRIFLTPKWLFGHLLVLLLVILFINFGFWQLDRLEERTAENALIEARLEAEPAGLGSLLADVDRAADSLASSETELEELAYRRTSVTGTFAPAHEILLRSRSRDGQPGWHLLTPLVLADGSALLVDRGWVPRGFDEPPVEEAAPPSGEVRVEGLLRLEEDPPGGWAASLSPRDPPDGELEKSYYVDLERLAPQYPFEVVPVYLQLTGVEPLGSQQARAGDGSSAGRAAGLPLPPQIAEFSRGPHLSYALQWFSFALIGVVGYSILLWRTLKEG